jgi:hypothetical protein
MTHRTVAWVRPEQTIVSSAREIRAIRRQAFIAFDFSSICFGFQLNGSWGMLEVSCKVWPNGK